MSVTESIHCQQPRIDCIRQDKTDYRLSPTCEVRIIQQQKLLVVSLVNVPLALIEVVDEREGHKCVGRNCTKIRDFNTSLNNGES